MSDLLLFVSVVVGGLLIGSFLTVVVDRVPRGESINRPPSACGNCGLRLGPLDLVPVVSWVALGGKCRRCRNPIGVEPIVIELANVAVWLLFLWKFGATAPLPAFLAWGSVLVAQSWIDLREQRLPREITFVGLGLGAIGLTVAALVDDEPERIWMSLLGAAIALAIIGAIYLGANWRYGTDVAFGYGDVILSPLLGLYVGYINPGIVPPAIFFGFILGSLAAIPAIIARRADGQTALPFGPFLAAGSVLAVFIGQDFVDLVLAR
ncbi:MAG: prepilin peptidase [Actinomycetota bacterium]